MKEDLRIDYTTTRVIVYNANGDVIGQAGVKDPKDFDPEVLYKIAMEKSGSKINAND